MKLDLDKLEELEKAATPCPWEERIASSEDDYEYFAIGPEHKYNPDADEIDDYEDKSHREQKADADAALIAALRNAAPALIAEIKAARDLLRAADFLKDLIPDNDVFEWHLLNKRADDYRKIVESNGGV